MSNPTPYILVRLDLPKGTVTEAQRLLHPLRDAATKALLSEALAHAVEHASGYRLYLAADGTEAPAPAAAAVKVIRSPFRAGMRRSSQS
jgi:hypothetical protein